MIIFGVDNGLKGGIAICNEKGELLHAVIMPTLEGKELDRPHICAFFNMWKPEWLGLEKAQAMPKQGVCSMFNYGKGYGVFLGIATALNIKMILLPPQTWQKVMLAGQNRSDTKLAAYNACQCLWPGFDFRATARCTTFHSGKVDAALIATYTARWAANQINPNQ